MSSDRLDETNDNAAITVQNIGHFQRCQGFKLSDRRLTEGRIPNSCLQKRGVFKAAFGDRIQTVPVIKAVSSYAMNRDK